jgi:hypothetical protein
LYFFRLQPFCLLEELPANEDDGEDTDHEVGEQEGGNVPLTWRRS